MTLLPLGITINDLNQLKLKKIQIPALKKIALQVPFLSIFSKQKNLNLVIYDPVIKIEDLATLGDLFGSSSAEDSFRIDQVRIVNGQFTLKTGDLAIELQEVDLYSRKSVGRTTFRINSPYLGAVFPLNDKMTKIEGSLTGELRQQPDGLKINNLNWKTKDSNINLNGRIMGPDSLNLNLSIQGNPYHILYPLLTDLSVNGFVYANANLTSDKAKGLELKGKFRSHQFSTGGEIFSTLEGNIRWDSRSEQLRLNASFASDSQACNLNLRNLQGKTELSLSNLPAGKVARMIRIYSVFPVGSRIKNSEISIDGNLVQGQVNLVQHPNGREGFNIGGMVDFSYHLDNYQTRFFSEDASNNTADFSLIKGEFIPAANSYSVSIKSKIKNTGEIHKYSSFFADLDLSFWNLNQGQGGFNLEISKKQKQYDLKIDFSLQDMSINNQSIRSLDGQIQSDGSRLRGDFKVNDPQLGGKVALSSSKKQLRVDFKKITGSSKKILQILKIDIPLAGNVNGDYSFILQDGASQPEITGDFSSQEAQLIGYDLKNIQGKLLANYEQIRLSNLNYSYKEGLGSGDVFINFNNREYALKGDLKRISLQKIFGELIGEGNLEFEGSGKYPRDPIKIKYYLTNAAFYKDRIFQTNGTATLSTDFSDFDLKITGNIDYKKSLSPFSFNIKTENRKYSGDFQLNLKDINLLIPWKDNTGEFIINGQIRTDEKGAISAGGLATFRGATLSFPNFPHTLDNFSGYLNFRNGEFNLKSLQGTMGGGRVRANGLLQLEGEKINNLTLDFFGENLHLFPMDRVSCKVNTNLRLNYENERLLLRGSINFLSALWQREVDEGIIFITNPVLSSSESTILKLLKFNLNLFGSKDIRMENTLGSLKGHFNLTLTGDVEFPKLSGTIESREGELVFSNKKFNLLKAKLTFNNKFFIDPKIKIESEAFIKNYRIKFAIDGTSSHLNPQFTASPPLPSQDIFALISMDELFERSTSEELASRIGSAGMISSAITDQIQKRAKKLLGIDLVKINPDVSGNISEGKSLLSVGKSITKNFIIIYSTNISTARREIWYVKYMLSKNLSLIGMRNEEGKFSVEIRYRKRR